MNYICSHCLRTFKTKHNYCKHVEFCKFDIQKDNDMLNEIDSFNGVPSFHELYNYVLKVSQRVTRLEKENKSLKRYISTKLIKIDPIQWLNENKKPISCFEEWLRNMNAYDYLETVFNSNLIEGIHKCILNNINSHTPIYAFDNKNLKFYVYVNDSDQWLLLDDKDYQDFINCIANKFLYSFGKYVTENEKLLQSENYIDNYISYQNKIYGDSNTHSRNNKIKSLLYNSIKKEVSCINIDE